MGQRDELAARAPWRSTGGNMLSRLFASYRIWPVLLVLVIAAAIASNGIFLRPSNLVSLLFVAAPTTLAALGQTPVIITAGIDLSAASIWILSAAVGASLAAQGIALPLAVIAALGVGVGGGLINGLLIAVLEIPPLITTLGTLSVGEGVARVYTKNVPILSVPQPYSALGGAYFGPVPLPILILLAVTLAMMFLMGRMAMGRRIYAVGGNERAARYAGVSVTGVLIFVYTVSGLLSGLAGLVQSAYVQEAVPNVDLNTLFAIIAAVVVGGTSLMGGQGNIVNTVGGALVIVVVENVMNILGISPLLAQGVLGIIVLLAVYLNVGLDVNLLRLWAFRRPSLPPAGGQHGVH